MAFPPSALDAKTQAFPSLTKEQIDRIRPMGRCHSVKQGQVLWEPGDTGVPFFVILTGNLEIVQPGLDGERAIVMHGPGEFTGEMAMLNNQQALVRGRVTEDGEVLELNADSMRELVAKDAEMSEIIMRAFILRRVSFFNDRQAGVIVIGAQSSAWTIPDAIR